MPVLKREKYILVCVGDSVSALFPTLRTTDDAFIACPRRIERGTTGPAAGAAARLRDKSED